LFCSNCGEKVELDQKFCTVCGADLSKQRGKADFNEVEMSEDSATVEQTARNFPEQVKGTFLHATEKINTMVGEQGKVEVNLRDVFSDVFKKHEKEEGEALFISGTKATTPVESDIPSTWPKPWLFSRVFLILASTYILLYICTFMFENSNALPGLNIIGSFAVPFSLLIFFWEMNAPRNISIYEITKMLFVGGAASLVMTLILFTFFPVYDLDFAGAIIVGIVEEVGKLAVIVYFIHKLRAKFILNGLLIGAAIGAGFAAFESAGYAFNYGSHFGEVAMLNLIFTRAWMSVGAHVVWSAIAGAAFVYAKGEKSVAADQFLDAKFLKLFAVPVILHAVWDMPLYFLHDFYLLFIVLIVIAWVFIFTLLSAGLKQIVRVSVGE